MLTVSVTTVVLLLPKSSSNCPALGANMVAARLLCTDRSDGLWNDKEWGSRGHGMCPFIREMQFYLHDEE